MSSTPHLVLPLLAAAQAQKHVTHNEALASLDALIHLAVKERGRAAAPGSPEEGERYLVGAGATGSFENHEGEIALFDLGIWRFFKPRPGWRAYVEAEDRIAVFDGTQWHDLGHYSRELDNLNRLGIGTMADDMNRLSAKLNAALLSALAAEEGGTGDLRFVLNKAGAENVLSQLYQRGFSGRAEAGLIGNDDFSIRVSPNGSEWHDALLVDRNTGAVSFPNGLSSVPGRNLLINAAFRVNQRTFAGDSLGEGLYGFDRWKGGTGGCMLNRAEDGTVTLTGTLDQVIDIGDAAALTGLSNLAGTALTLSVEDPSSPLQVRIGTKTSSIPAGPGRRTATVILDAAETANITVRLQAASACSFKRVKLEVGSLATAWAGDPLEVEELRCRRYYQRLAASGGAPRILGAIGQRVGADAIDIPYTLPVPMRAAPTLEASGFSWSDSSPVGNQIGFYDNGDARWITMSGGLAVVEAVPPSSSSILVRFRAGTSFGGTAGAVGTLYLGNSAFIALQAEL